MANKGVIFIPGEDWICGSCNNDAWALTSDARVYVCLDHLKNTDIGECTTCLYGYTPCAGIWVCNWHYLRWLGT